MPELPEVELAVRRLRPFLEGRRLVAVEPHHPSARRAIGTPRAAKLAGRVVQAVTRRGKYQLLTLDDGATLVAHFRLDGDWLVAPATQPLHRHARISLTVESGQRISLIDPRALATITWHAAHEPLLPSLGPEPWDATLTAPSWRTVLARRSGEIKQILLDQQVIAGVGNIYAAEALWHAALHPRIAANTLGVARLERLLDAVRVALTRGLEEPGRYYASALAEPRTSASVHALHVYDREGEPCDRCQAPIRRITQGGRSTYYCSACQKR